jgi:hypothetical protein
MIKHNIEPLPLEIRCFAKNARIVSGEDAQGKHWLLSEVDAIDGLQEGTLSFHVRLNGREIPIIVAADLTGQKFLAARVEGKITDDLLLVPDFVPNEIHSVSAISATS